MCAIVIVVVVVAQACFQSFIPWLDKIVQKVLHGIILILAHVIQSTHHTTHMQTNQPASHISLILCEKQNQMNRSKSITYYARNEMEI